jgi:hypothetical protein
MKKTLRDPLVGSFMRYEARSLRNPGRQECLSTQSPSSVIFSHDEPDRSDSRLLCEPAPTGPLVPPPQIAPVTALDAVEQPLSVLRLPAEADTPIPMVISEDMERMVFETYLEHFGHWVSRFPSSRPEIDKRCKVRRCLSRTAFQSNCATVVSIRTGPVLCVPSICCKCYGALGKARRSRPGAISR